MKVTLEIIKLMQALRSSINSTPLEDIVWYENNWDREDNRPIKIDPVIIDEFCDIGLNNIDFITSGYYKRAVKEGKVYHSIPELREDLLPNKPADFFNPKEVKDK